MELSINSLRWRAAFITLILCGNYTDEGAWDGTCDYSSQ
jgi:hypothetical protein